MRKHLKELTQKEIAEATILTLIVIGILSVITIISNL
jgi:hypothetical protein